MECLRCDFCVCARVRVCVCVCGAKIKLFPSSLQFTVLVLHMCSSLFGLTLTVKRIFFLPVREPLVRCCFHRQRTSVIFGACGVVSSLLGTRKRRWKKNITVNYFLSIFMNASYR